MQPRSQRAHEKVLQSAMSLFAELGIEGTSMDAIAGHSGVSKATIYKHWPDKKALCLEALGRAHGLHIPRPQFNTGDLRADLTGFLSYKPPAECTLEREKMMPSVMAYAARDREFGRAWREQILGRATREAKELIQRGIETGQLHADLDPNFGVAMLLGPMMYGKMFGDSSPIPADLPRRVTEAFLRAFGSGASKK